MNNLVPLFLLFFPSQVFLKLSFFEAVFENEEICQEIRQQMSEKRIVEITAEFIVHPEILDQTKLCFLECFYQANYLNVVYKSSEKKDLFSLVQTTTQLQSISTELKMLCLSTGLLCSLNRSSEKFCLKLVKEMECFKAMIFLHLNNYDDIFKSETRNLEQMLEVMLIKFRAFLYLRTDLFNSKISVSSCSANLLKDVTSRYKRYVLHKEKWKKKSLSYEISKYSDILPRDAVDIEISRAFQLWTSVVPLKITFVPPGNGDIIVRFEKFKHGDVPFDGPGTVLAHTFYPITLPNGDQKSFIHFDDSEKWTVNSSKGINLFQTALHEVGHSLGLKHSNVMHSIMRPKSDVFQLNSTLGEDDIKGIQSLYGTRT